jgi:hypothetical protein
VARNKIMMKRMRKRIPKMMYGLFSLLQFADLSFTHITNVNKTDNAPAKVQEYEAKLMKE